MRLSQQSPANTSSVHIPISTESIVQEAPTTLPTYIVVNPRKKINPVPIPAIEIASKQKEQVVRENKALWFVPLTKPKEPIPKDSLHISWTPKVLCFNLEEEIVLRQLVICNRSRYMIYIGICGLWDDTARLGASWYCYPRTRLLLAPGMVKSVFVKAEPKKSAPVPGATMTLQLATAHLRDTVVGYFAVPICVKFLNYTPPPELPGEGE